VNYFERNVQTINPTITGSQHGKKTRSTLPGYRTKNRFGNGNPRRGDLRRTSPKAFEVTYILEMRLGE
jgi:hypothetical protein